MTKHVFLAVAALASIGAAPAPADTVDITVTVTNMRNAHGVVRACMTHAEKSFPQCRGVPSARSASIAAREGKVMVKFTGVEPGQYAIALLHDENGNGKADRALGMMPKEGFGFSRDAPVRMGPPSFSDAAFDVTDDDRAMTIKMRYMF